MNYIGSKFKLLSFLQDGIGSEVNGLSGGVLLDIFAGTGVIGHYFKGLGYKVIANDIQYYSYCLNRAKVGLDDTPTFARLISKLGLPEATLFDEPVDTVLSFLNQMEGTEGFTYRNYCPGGTAESENERQYFTDENGKKCDAIRTTIEEWFHCELINEDEYFYLLAGLIEAMDIVANTASVYGAFLKHIKKTALKPITLKRLKLVKGPEKCEVHNEEAAFLASVVDCDILYMDPPYNHRQYCANYHVLETIARNDSPTLKGVTGLRPYDIAFAGCVPGSSHLPQCHFPSLRIWKISRMRVPSLNGMDIAPPDMIHDFNN